MNAQARIRGDAEGALPADATSNRETGRVAGRAADALAKERPRTYAAQIPRGRSASTWGLKVNLRAVAPAHAKTGTLFANDNAIALAA